jgi:hypothetical protein
MQRKPTIALIAVLIMLVGGPAFSQTGTMAFDLSSARTAASGGVHAAVTNDLASLFSNPAGFRAAEPQISLAEISLGMSGPIFDIAGLVIQGMNQEMEELLASETVQNLVANLYAAADILGPINFGYLGKGLGFGFFNTTDVEFISRAPLTVTALAGEQITLAGGYAFRVPFPEGSPSALDLGILLKGSLRGQIEFTQSLLELTNLFSGVSLDFVTDKPFDLTTGIGLDVGIRYAYKDVFAFGIVGKDLYSPTLTQSYATVNGFLDSTAVAVASNGLAPIDLTAGVLFAPRLGVLGRYVNDLQFFLDYVDILDFLTHPGSVRNPVLHVSLGAELRMLEILMIRGGFSQGLFAAGLGIDLTIFGINIAMFGTELGSEPGIRPAYNAIVGIEFRL